LKKYLTNGQKYVIIRYKKKKGRKKMVVAVYVNHERGEVLSEKQFEEKVLERVENILDDNGERDSYLNDYLEREGFDCADCFQMPESRRQDIKVSFKEWLTEDVRAYLLDIHFDEYIVEI
jgi:hypothetical protein